MGTETVLDQVVMGLFIGMVILLLSLPVSLVIWGALHWRDWWKSR
jgi:hypothetical protein